MMKRNEGFTLIELIVSIAVSTIVTAGVLSILLFGMRINAKTAGNVKQQNAMNMLAQIVQTVSEEPNIAVRENKIVQITVDSENNESVRQVFVRHDQGNILLNGTVFMEDVAKMTVTMNDKNLLTMQIWMDGNTTDTPDYTTSVHCRLNQGGTADES